MEARIQQLLDEQEAAAKEPPPAHRLQSTIGKGKQKVNGKLLMALVEHTQKYSLKLAGYEERIPEFRKQATELLEEQEKNPGTTHMLKLCEVFGKDSGELHGVGGCSRRAE